MRTPCCLPLVVSVSWSFTQPCASWAPHPPVTWVSILLCMHRADGSPRFLPKVLRMASQSRGGLSAPDIGLPSRLVSWGPQSRLFHFPVEILEVGPSSAVTGSRKECGPLFRWTVFLVSCHLVDRVPPVSHSEEPDQFLPIEKCVRDSLPALWWLQVGMLQGP